MFELLAELVNVPVEVIEAVGVVVVWAVGKFGQSKPADRRRIAELEAVAQRELELDPLWGDK